MKRKNGYNLIEIRNMISIFNSSAWISSIILCIVYIYSSPEYTDFCSIFNGIYSFILIPPLRRTKKKWNSFIHRFQFQLNDCPIQKLQFEKCLNSCDSTPFRECGRSAMTLRVRILWWHFWAYRSALFHYDSVIAIVLFHFNRFTIFKSVFRYI